ncbi:DUF3939 domain-containing protein [Aquibacillus koreensis]|uniref:DUF3939 domain-containing protein n=1 Tax=Aquibacillus koreensis TaxID=279446 RepID=A0A9X3WMN4_9BACI|nr:DUF3939 domain-containing protein [Aquibacillus koreensis]MCT2535596.1 DUF3939 domain-containing protein [Aquibacillus koreensis]MDC3420119.1 DUF3939 domain-containing protein [Aquibacillus koreensis]
MWEKFKKKKETKPKEEKEYPIVDITLDVFKKAIQDYSRQLPGDIPLSVIINEDLTIDYQLLAPILKGIPKQTYYMSKETYEIFEENDYQLALEIDAVQQAVDKYMRQTDELPVIQGDPYKKVSFHKLESLNLLQHRPKHHFYITNDEFLITYDKPQ